MAWRVTAVQHKTKIPFLLSHTQKQKISHPQEIANEFSEFYCKRYNLKDASRTEEPSGQAIDSFLGSINLPSVSESQLRDLNLPFSEEKIVQVIRTLPNVKSPGPDGFSNEYIK